MDTPNKSEQPCPGPAKSSRSRVESLREKRERLKAELRKASAQVALAEQNEQKLQRIQARQVARNEREQLGTLCQQVGLDRYRRAMDASNPDSPTALDAELIGGFLRWLIKSTAVQSPEDHAVMREEGAALIKEMQVKKDARVKRDAPTQKGGGTPHPTFESLE